MSTSRWYAPTHLLLPLALLIVLPAAATGQEVLIPAGSTWKYLDDGSDQDSVWTQPGFPDTSWNAGPAQLGYGDGDEATVVGFGPNANAKYITTYFRRSFDVPDPSPHAYLFVRLLRDDGAVVHLNGHELLRSNMNDGPVDSSTVAAGTVGSTAEDTFYERYANAGNLQAGTNVLAVEIHQRSGTSSDISFDLELLGVPEIPHPVRKTPYLVLTGDDAEMCVVWQLLVPDTCRIEWGLDSSYSLGSADTYEYGTDHQHRYTIEGLTSSTRYHYRVVVEADTFAGTFLSPPSASATQARFLAYGDCRTYPATHDQVAASILGAVSRAPGFQSLLISVGDLVSNGDLESDWDGEFFNRSYPNLRDMYAGLPYLACMGNHEGAGVLFKKYFPYPYQAARYWSFDYGPAHFVVVDQYVDYSAGSAQYAWIQNDLASTDKWWRFIYLHEPGWSGGGNHSNDATVQDDIQPLCEQYGVPIVFAGHNHYYVRAEVNGVQHITTGGGGAPLYAPDLGYPNVVTGAAAYHYCEVVMDGGALSFAAISIAGDTLDTFTVQSPVTAVEPGPPGARPPALALHRAVPNPFRSGTTLSFTLERPERVTLVIFDLNGRRVRTLVDADLGEGTHGFPWDGRDDSGRRLGSGLYFYRLGSAEEVRSNKVLLMR